MKKHSIALTIAGSDSGGGAGIQADLKTFSALNCYGASVITALTAQNTQEVRAIHPVPPAFIKSQLETVLDDLEVNAVKIGMLHSSAVIEVVAETLKAYQVENIVLDPVMVATSGDRLIEQEAVAALKDLLLPMATLVTPNLPEAAILLGMEESELPTLTETALKFSDLGLKSVLLKGGHLEDDHSSDVLYMSEYRDIVAFPEKRINTKNTHGTGCTLSSAITANLARGNEMIRSVELAKAYITRAIKEGKDYQVGKGNGPVHHFYALWGQRLKI